MGDLSCKFETGLIEFQQLIMKSKIQKNTALKDDQKYLEGINLITGDKIDYAKHLLTETEINAMCINQKLSKIDKFIQILTHGEKIQKWSIFQNLAQYIETSENAERILAQIEKNYHEYEEFITIIGQGFHSYLKKSYESKELMNPKCYDCLYRLLHRTVTAAKYQGSDILNEWMASLTVLFQFPEGEAANGRRTKLGELRQYINGSFSMSTLPERRKTALELINSLLDLSQQIENQAPNKILFFNNDLNPSTRLVICTIMEKILIKNSKNAQIWKCVQDYYYTDKSKIIKERSFQILSKIYFKANAQLVFQEFQNEENDCVEIVVKYSLDIFLTFEVELKRQSKLQVKVISFLNRLLRKNFEQTIGSVIESYKILMLSVPEAILVDELQLKKFDLESIGVICHLIVFHRWIGHIEFKEEIKKQILKGVRYHEFDIKFDRNTISNLLEILDISCEEDVAFFTLILAKQVDSSRWRNIELFLDRITEIKLYQTQYQRIMASTIKIYHNLHGVIYFLMLNDRKNMEIYQKIKEKYINSRCWMHRRNYIKLYAFLKRNASFQFCRLFPPLIYKNILNEKNVLLKQQFAKQFHRAYQFMDPTLQQEKNAIRQTVSKIAQDKDRQLSTLALSTVDRIRQVDKDYELIHRMIMRNKEVYEKQMEVEQVQSETKKHIKTEKIISKDGKKKTGTIDNKTSLNLIRLGNIDRNKAGEGPLTLKRSNSSQNKKEPLKFLLPTYKKSRF